MMGLVQQIVCHPGAVYREYERGPLCQEPWSYSLVVEVNEPVDVDLLVGSPIFVNVGGEEASVAKLELTLAVAAIQKHCRLRGRTIEFYSDGNVGERGPIGSADGFSHTPETLAMAIIKDEEGRHR